jgi:hypothetical protein
MKNFATFEILGRIVRTEAPIGLVPRKVQGTGGGWASAKLGKTVRRYNIEHYDVRTLQISQHAPGCRTRLSRPRSRAPAPAGFTHQAYVSLKQARSLR